MVHCRPQPRPRPDQLLTRHRASPAVSFDFAMTSPSSTPTETRSTALCKKPLSFKWVIHDAIKSLKLEELKSPCLTVILKPATASNSSWDSMWHLYIKSFGGLGGLSELSLCQGRQDGKYGERHSRKSPDGRKVSISNCVFSILNPSIQSMAPLLREVESSEDESSDEESVLAPTECMINNKKPMKCVSRSFKFAKYLHDDMLTIQVQADLSFVGDIMEYDLPPDNMREGIHSLYESEVFTDAIVRCEDKEFKVHRTVLASQSPVFRAMFEVDMKEKQSGIVEVSDITPAVMSDLVAYLYTGTAPNLKTLASELLDVAEKYQLPRLLKMSENELGSKIKGTNVVEILILADLHNRVSLKKACFEFIRLNSAKVFQTREWADFKDHKDQYVSLFVEVLENVLRS